MENRAAVSMFEVLWDVEKWKTGPLLGDKTLNKAIRKKIIKSSGLGLDSLCGVLQLYFLFPNAYLCSNEGQANLGWKGNIKTLHVNRITVEQ